VGFEYRALSGEDVHARSTPWVATATKTLGAPGAFSVEVEGLPAGAYEFHAVAKHPLLTLYGADKTAR
jgi:alpha-L-fucosidase